MQPKFNNHIFHKGLKDSLDISKLKNDTWAFPTLNVRLLNKDGQGYIITPIKGNTVNSGTSVSPIVGGTDNTGSVMKTQTNYVIIAAKEFNGIIYILSAKNDGSGQGEIGVYPAPNVLIPNPTAGVTPSQTGFPTATNTYPFGRFYAPLGNFVPMSLSAEPYDAVNTSYALNDFTNYNGSIYENINPLTAPAGVFNLADWSLVYGLYNPTQASAYTIGTQIIYNSQLWQCVVATSNPPGSFDITKWTLASQFNSTAFAFTFENMTELEIRPDYDNSVNLYIVDYTNPNRAINSGFNITTGALNGRAYNPTSFFSTLNQILGTSKSLSVSSIDIIPGGSHKYGNYFFYLRYMDASLNVTDTVCVSNACQIFNGDMGTLSSVQGGNGTTATPPYSGKTVTLHLSNIDTSYAYIDVVYQRFYSDTSTQVQLSETYEIATPYPMSRVLSTNSITIIGNESVVDVDTGELLTITGVENKCKTQAQLGNHWWGGNWKGIKLTDPSLITFAQNIRITYDDISETRYGGSLVSRKTGDVDSASIPSLSNNQYKDYKDTYDYVGYFRGEPYAFAVVFELNTGQETQAYPLNGCDNFDDISLLANALAYNPATLISNANYREGNYNGLYRFPNTDNSNAYKDDTDPTVSTPGGLRILGVKFDMTNAIALGILPWMQANVRGMYFVRQDRVPTLLYQGVMLPQSKSYLCGSSGDNDISYTIGYAPGWNPSLSDTLKTIMDDGTHGQRSGGDADTDVSEIGCGGGSYGQYHGKFAGSFLPGCGKPWSNDWWGAGVVYDSCVGSSNSESNPHNVQYKDLFFPVYRGYMPMIYYLGRSGANYSRYYTSRWFHYHNEHAFYSPDALIEQGNVDIQTGSSTGYYVRRVAVTDDASLPSRWSNLVPPTGDLQPNLYMAEVAGGYGSSNGKPSEKITNLYNIGAIDSTPANPDASKYLNASDDFTGISSSMDVNGVLFFTEKSSEHEYWSNRTIRTSRYLGIKTSYIATYPCPDDGYYRLAISNIYNTQPENVKHSGTFSMANIYSSIYSSPYHKISDYIQIFDKNGKSLLQPSYTCYKGDCFLQRFYFKQMVWDCSRFTSNNQDGVSGGDAVGCNNTGTRGPVWDASDGANSMRYAHGLIIGVVTENKHNNAMRFADGTPAYYPEVDAFPWNMTPPGSGNGYESWEYNTGNDRVLDEMTYFAFNPTVPQPANIHLTRIRYSDFHNQYAIVDGYKRILPAYYKDFDSSYQQIMKILSFDDNLVSVQEDCVNKHFTLQQEIDADITSGQITLGTGDVLSQIVRKLADYGTQHQYSVIKTDNGIYGVDSFRRLIWRLGMSTTITGSYVMGGKEFNREKFVEKWLYDWFDEVQPITDIIGRLPDTPLLGYGITANYDSKYKDVILSFFSYNTGNSAYTIQGITAFNMMWSNITNYSTLYQVVFNQADQNWYYSIRTGQGFQPDLFPLYWKLIDFSTLAPYDSNAAYLLGSIFKCCTGANPCDAGKIFIVNTLLPVQSGRFAMYVAAINNNTINISCCEDISKALVINEDVDEFIGETNYPTVIGVSNYKDFFTTGNPSTNGMQSYMWQHDMPDYLWFYGGQDPMKISWYENGNSEGNAEAGTFTKFFESQDIHGDDKLLYEIEWQTEYQDGNILPFIDRKKFWRNPEYLEHHWKVPIMVKEDANNNAFNTGSSMQGTWLLTTLTYWQNVKTFIKNISTWYRDSRV